MTDPAPMADREKSNALIAEFIANRTNSKPFLYFGYTSVPPKSNIMVFIILYKSISNIKLKKMIGKRNFS